MTELHPSCFLRHEAVKIPLPKGIHCFASEETGARGLASPQKHRGHLLSIDLGDEDPLYTRNLGSGPPDRRRVSLRWLAGSVLTGIFSFVLVGGALQAAIGLDEDFIVRPALARTTAGDAGSAAHKGDRFRPAPQSEVTRRVIQISTVTRQDDRDIVRVRPFAHVHTNLAAPVPVEVAERVPGFNPLAIFSEGAPDPAEVAGSDSIYGAEVDGEVAIKVEDFPVAGAAFDESAELGVNEVEQAVRQAAPSLADGAVEVASLPYVDPARFDMTSAEPNALASLAIAIKDGERHAAAKTRPAGGRVRHRRDRCCRSPRARRSARCWSTRAQTEAQAAAIQSALVANFSFDFRAGQKVRLGLAPDGTGAVRPVRVSLYDRRQPPRDRRALRQRHLCRGRRAGACRRRRGRRSRRAPTPRSSGALPSVYDGLWGTGPVARHARR